MPKGAPSSWRERLAPCVIEGYLEKQRSSGRWKRVYAMLRGDTGTLLLFEKEPPADKTPLFPLCPGNPKIRSRLPRDQSSFTEPGAVLDSPAKEAASAAVLPRASFALFACTFVVEYAVSRDKIGAKGIILEIAATNDGRPAIEHFVICSPNRSVAFRVAANFDNKEVQNSMQNWAEKIRIYCHDRSKFSHDLSRIDERFRCICCCQCPFKENFGHQHTFKRGKPRKKSRCDVCNKDIKGLTKTAFECVSCGYVCHMKCYELSSPSCKALILNHNLPTTALHGAEHCRQRSNSGSVSPTLSGFPTRNTATGIRGMSRTRTDSHIKEVFIPPPDIPPEEIVILPPPLPPVDDHQNQVLMRSCFLTRHMYTSSSSSSVSDPRTPDIRACFTPPSLFTTMDSPTCDNIPPPVAMRPPAPTHLGKSMYTPVSHNKQQEYEMRMNRDAEEIFIMRKRTEEERRKKQELENKRKMELQRVIDEENKRIIDARTPMPLEDLRAMAAKMTNAELEEQIRRSERKANWDTMEIMEAYEVKKAPLLDLCLRRELDAALAQSDREYSDLLYELGQRSVQFESRMLDYRKLKKNDEETFESPRKSMPVGPPSEPGIPPTMIALPVHM